MTTDDQSMISSISDISKAINKTQIYGRGDVSGGIDQTFAVRNPLQDGNFTKQQTSEKGEDKNISNMKDDDMETDVPAFQSMLGNTHHHILQKLDTMGIQYKYKSESNLQGFHSTLGNTDEHGIEDLTISLDTNFKAEVSGELVIQDPITKSSSLLPSDLVARTGVVQEELLRSPSFHHIASYKNNLRDKENKIANVLELPPVNHTHEDYNTTNKTFEAQQKSPSFPHVEPYTKHLLANKENIFENALELSPMHQTHSNGPEVHDATNKTTEDMTLCSIANEIDIGATSRGKISSPEPSQLRRNNVDMANNNKMPKSALFDVSGSQDNQFPTDFSFANADPLSSTRFAPINNLTPNFTNSGKKMKANTSNVTFNYCPSLTARQSRDFRSAMSSHDNTDELCNLEPEQLRKRSNMKKLFLDITNAVPQDMLSETQFDLINESNVEELVTNEGPEGDQPAELLTEKGPSNVKMKQEFISNDFMTEKLATNVAVKVEDVGGPSSVISAKVKMETYNGPRCRKCLNCRKSLDGNNSSFSKIENSNEQQLDFSIYDQFKGLASFKDVIEARKKRNAARELQKQLLVDQNVEAPDIRFLWENKSNK